MNGNNILIYLGSTLIGGMKSNNIETSCDSVEVSSPATGEWKTYIEGRKSWSVSVSYLILAASGLSDLLTVGTSYTLKIQGRGETSYLSGTAILTNCKITATRGNLVQGSFTFNGTGALAATTASST